MPLFQQPFMSGGFPSMNRAAGAIGGWVELGRTTLGGAASSITVSSLSDKRYYMILCSNLGTSGSTGMNLELNSDTGNNYAYRVSTDGGADSTVTSTSAGRICNQGGTDPQFAVSYLANRSANEKLVMAWSIDQSSAGEANAPNRDECVSKWDNTSNAINSITLSAGANTYNTGSELVVLGWDPDDTHTNNFWEELAEVTASGSSNTMDTGSFTAKKYLWVQAYVSGSGTGSETDLDMALQFNSDTGTNYADRLSSNGGADGTVTSNSSVQFMHDRGTAYTGGRWTNAFFVNNASNEKLGIWHYYRGVSGAATAPNRTEGVGKWDNTSNQITSVQGKTNGSNPNYPSGSFIKVWGAD